MNITKNNVNEFGFEQVLITMLWSECDDTEMNDPLDYNYDINDIDTVLVESIQNKYLSFLETALTILPPDFIPDWSSMGHDFWLTCRGHGAGFWDRQELTYQNIGGQLTKACEDIYLPELYCENGRIYSHSF